MLRSSVNTQGTENCLDPDQPLVKLNRVIQDGVLKVGGRLTHAPLDQAERSPLILGKQSHVTKLLVQQHHKEVKHQGRQFTEGATRAAGLWIVGGKRLIRSVLHDCITCRKLRGKMEKQKMADLSPERLIITDICWFGCIWTLDSGHSANKRRCSSKQALGDSLCRHEYPSGTY